MALNAVLRAEKVLEGIIAGGGVEYRCWHGVNPGYLGGYKAHFMRTCARKRLHGGVNGSAHACIHRKSSRFFALNLVRIEIEPRAVCQQKVCPSSSSMEMRRHRRHGEGIEKYSATSAAAMYEVAHIRSRESRAAAQCHLSRSGIARNVANRKLEASAASARRKSRRGGGGASRRHQHALKEASCEKCILAAHHQRK